MKNTLFPPQKEHGAVLVVGLILLLAMTLLAMAGSTNSLIATRLAGNAAAKNASFQAANAALDLTIQQCLDAAKNSIGKSVDCSVALQQLFTRGEVITGTITATKSIMDGTSLALASQFYTVDVQTSATVNGVTTQLAMGIVTP